MTTPFDDLVALLKELFQLDQPDLDFGIYRVLHARRREVSDFLKRDLLPQVRAAFDQYRPADKAALERELGEAEGQLRALGVDPETSPKVLDLRRRVAETAVDVGKLETEVYEHLLTFFRRYYSEGDFLSRRVYKDNTYAVPYAGEEVKLHWANADQYYVKTSEYLRDYAFRLRPDDPARPMRVRFRLVDAAEGEHGNVKAAEGKERVFVLAPGEAVAEAPGTEPGADGPELEVRFEYRPATLADWGEGEGAGRAKPPGRRDLVGINERRILAAADPALAPWLDALQQRHAGADGAASERSRLAVHLDRYTARNTFDYFIHKDLGGFLRRELDFYVKNEVMHLDDVERETAPRVEQYLSKIRVIRRVAGKVIDFLAQLEDFQKRLWLKKKFVVETQYCVTVDRVPDALLAEVAACGAQREEWVRLYAIRELQGGGY